MQQRFLATKLEIVHLQPFREIVSNPCFNVFALLLRIAILFFPGKRPGQCPCKEGYAGEKCDRCQFGYKAYPTCVRCECSRAGSVNEDPCSEPCLCKVRVQVKDDPEFPLRCPKKTTQPIGSGDQFLSKAARFK